MPAPTQWRTLSGTVSAGEPSEPPFHFVEFMRAQMFDSEREHDVVFPEYVQSELLYEGLSLFQGGIEDNRSDKKCRFCLVR